MNKVYLLNVSMFEDESLYQKAMQMISNKRIEKMKQFKNPAAARLSLGAGVLLTLAMDRNGLKDRVNEIQTEKYGKPILSDTNFYFSLSHSGEYALCAVSDVPVGADLQKIKDKIPDKTRRILSAEEDNYLQNACELQRKELFYRFWARKESLIKWDGRGLRLPLQELSFVKKNYLQNQITYGEKQLYFHEFDLLLPEYSICVCSEKEIFINQVEEIMSEILTKY